MNLDFVGVKPTGDMRQEREREADLQVWHACSLACVIATSIDEK
jgi:hypothetical protein